MFVTAFLFMPHSYLALGDSYTIGEAVSEKGNWPNQLINRLNDLGYQYDLPHIIAKTGWTTNELLEAIQGVQLQPSYTVVSLQIGVNNQYRGYSIQQYKTEFTKLLKLATQLGQQVFVLSIPDYGCTPFGKEKAIQINDELIVYNEIASSICQDNNVSFFDIFHLSKLALQDQQLTASDGLHPSKEMYTHWVDSFIDRLVALL